MPAQPALDLKIYSSSGAENMIRSQYPAQMQLKRPSSTQRHNRNAMHGTLSKTTSNPDTKPHRPVLQTLDGELLWKKKRITIDKN